MSESKSDLGGPVVNTLGEEIPGLISSRPNKGVSVVDVLDSGRRVVISLLLTIQGIPDSTTSMLSATAATKLISITNSQFSCVVMSLSKILHDL